MKGRKKPYTQIGIGRVPCAKCGEPSTQQWQICSNNNRYLGICTYCDVELNRTVLEFMNFPDVDKMIEQYIVKLLTVT